MTDEVALTVAVRDPVAVEVELAVGEYVGEEVEDALRVAVSVKLGDVVGVKMGE